MNKFWQKIIIVFVIPLFVFSGIICCCFADKAQAAESMPTCHRAAESQQSNDVSRHADTQSSEGCGCAHKVDFLARKIIPTVDLVGSIFLDVKDILLLNDVVSDVSLDAAIILAYQGLPQSIVDLLPIYLRLSNLRL